jgi:hypothetical protein
VPCSYRHNPGLFSSGRAAIVDFGWTRHQVICRRHEVLLEVVGTFLQSLLVPRRLELKPDGRRQVLATGRVQHVHSEVYTSRPAFPYPLHLPRPTDPLPRLSSVALVHPPYPSILRVPSAVVSRFFNYTGTGSQRHILTHLSSSKYRPHPPPQSCPLPILLPPRLSTSSLNFCRLRGSPRQPRSGASHSPVL